MFNANEKPLHTLIADDDASMRDLLETWLEGLPYIVYLVKSGLEAADFLSRRNPEIDLLITDFEMPGMDGIDLLEWCRRGDFRFPVIFTTSHRGHFNRKALSLDDSCADFLRKPFTYASLRAALDSARARGRDKSCRMSLGRLKSKSSTASHRTPGATPGRRPSPPSH